MSRIIKVLILLLAFCAKGTANDFIVIVLDTSASMGDPMGNGSTRMQLAQESLIQVLSNLPDTTNVGIVSFQGWVYKLGPVDRAKLSAAIRSTRPSGKTPLYTYLKGAATDLLKKREDQGNVGYYKLLVVTDGEASDRSLNKRSRHADGSIRLGVLEDIIQRGIVVDTIGLDMRGNHSLSNQINGAYMSGDDPQSLTNAVSKAVAEIGHGDGRDTSEEAFDEISDLSEAFAAAAIMGLTRYLNHPIGQRSPQATLAPDPGDRGHANSKSEFPISQTESDSDAGGLSFTWLLFVVICILWVSRYLRKAQRRHG